MVATLLCLASLILESLHNCQIVKAIDLINIKTAKGYLGLH